MATHLASALTLLRRKQVEALTGYSRSTIYLRISQGLFIRPVSLGARAVGFPAAEVTALNAARIAGRSDEQIRELVRSLEAARLSVEAGTVAEA
ncbi:MAG: AlpA family phage regulatory protein [Burkholderiaceae bacterium]|nr:MAG: AlpA family phage regulatory protein [Burkholderiaceae bacterium]